MGPIVDPSVGQISDLPAADGNVREKNENVEKHFVCCEGEIEKKNYFLFKFWLTEFCLSNISEGIIFRL